MKIRLAIVLALLVGGCDDDSGNGGNDMGNTPADMTMMAPRDMTSPGDMEQMQAKRHVIVFVWDGMRPDAITQADTPNLFALKQGGVEFTDNHSTYPTFTMMNSAAFATGSFPGTTGFYGNTFYPGFPNPTGNSSAGTPADFVDPIFTEDYAVLEDLDSFYSGQLLLVGTLFQAAQSHGLTTAAVGKSGAAFLQDYKKGGFIVDEKMIMPLSLEKEVQATDAVPSTTAFAYPAGTIELGTTNGNPTASGAKVTLADKTSSNPMDTSGSPVAAANYYMMDIYLRYVLPKLPDLTLIWFRAPDSPEHNYGPGSPNTHAAWQQQDLLLGQLQAKLKEMNLDTHTDIIVVSDHGHSSVSGPFALFPLRDVSGTGATATVGATDSASGFSVSGDVRLADLLTRAGFTNVFDGAGCEYVPVMSGMTGSAATGTQIYPDLTDTTGSVCGGAAMAKYTTGSFLVPSGALPAKSIVIATNGGSDYIYVPDHDSATVQNVITFLQEREEVGAIFVHSRYNDVGGHPPVGTLPLQRIKVENASRSPDIVYSYTWDDTAVVAGMPGIEFESMSASSNRGMHGSFSTRDVHNTLIAGGPDFKTSFQDPLPSGNVDVAPTVAKLFGLSLPQADGRSLDEALAQNGANTSDYASTPSMVTPNADATGLSFQVPTDPTGATKDTALTVGSYSIQLNIKTLTRGTSSWTYFDSAKAIRQ